VPLLASRVEQRAVIRFFWAKGLSTAEIHNEMQPVYGHKCFNLSVIKRWCRKFSNGRTSLVDNKRSGRHLAATDNDVVKKIDQFIRTDRRVSISDISFFTPEFHEVRFIQWCMIISSFTRCLLDGCRDN
jgi:transposase